MHDLEPIFTPGTRAVDILREQPPLTKADFAFYAEYRPRVTPVATILKVTDVVELVRRAPKFAEHYRRVAA